MRFHVPGLPHTVTNSKYIHCAFTQKVFKLCKMLHSLGHEVYHYGCEGSNPTCTEHIDVVEDEFRKQFYPDEWHDKQWDYDIKDECHQVFYKNAIKEINRRKGNHDFFLASWGWGHKAISDALGNSVMTVEPGIGYKDTFCQYRVFESYNWMSHVYGQGFLDKKGKRKAVENGKYFDAVIPNYFDPEDFVFTPDDKEDYFLYLGRMVKRKGIEVVKEIAKATGIHVKLAGQGSMDIPPSTRGEIIEYVGFADAEKRKELLSKAKGLLMPTIYIEPFGGVSIESLISGTPVLCSDWGVFPETIPHGVVGYRCRTLDHYVWGVRNIENISPQTCRDYALSNFSITRVAAMYQEYFEMLSSLWNKKGWYLINNQRENLSWLDRKHPEVTPNSNTREKVLLPQEDITIYPKVL
jgi:glycosyltransferase involved in cell wall biosynthesis